jgi:hypothetical protein
VDAIEAMRVAVGPGVVLLYTLQGLFHPARKVREVYWRIVSSINDFFIISFMPLFSVNQLILIVLFYPFLTE